MTRGSAHVMLEQRGVGHNWVNGDLERPLGRGRSPDRGTRARWAVGLLVHDDLSTLLAAVDIMSDIRAWEAISMPSIIVRGLDESVKNRLAAQAKEHGRSMEAEVRHILTCAASRPHIGLALMSAARDVGGIDGLLIPERTDAARAVDFG